MEVTKSLHADEWDTDLNFHIILILNGQGNL